MNEANRPTVVQQAQPWLRDENDWQVVRNERRKRIREQQLEQLIQLFGSFQLDRSFVNEQDLLRFVMKALIKRARFEYRKVWPIGMDGADDAAEFRALDRVRSIWKHLHQDRLKSANHLQAKMSLYCRHFKADGVKASEERVQQIKTVPLYDISIKDGKEEEVQMDEIETRLHPVSTPSSYDVWQAESVTLRDEETKGAAIYVGRSPFESSLTRENVLLLPFLSPEHAQTFETLRDFEGDRSEAADCLGLTEDGMNQRIHRMAERYQQMRELRFAFRKPAEHQDDLTDRFVDFTKRLQTFTKPEFPKTLAMAIVQCDEDLPIPDSPQRYDPYEVMNHLLRLWRPHKPTRQ